MNKSTQPVFQRRSLLRSLVGGSLLLPGILPNCSPRTGPRRRTDPLAPRTPHFKPRAKRVIFLNMSGGVSHVDSFDYKPRLIADHNKSYQVPQRMLEAFAPNNRVVGEVFQAAAVGVQAARAIGPVDQRAFSARGRVCRRPVPDPVDA